MEIFLFVMGVVFIVIGLPFCLSCQIHALLEKNSKVNTKRANQPSYQHGKRDRNIGLLLMIIGVLLIIFSFAASAM